MVVMPSILIVVPEIGYSAQNKEGSPANVKRLKIIDCLANKQDDDMCYQRHNKAGCGNKLIGVHLLRIVYF